MQVSEMTDQVQPSEPAPGPPPPTPLVLADVYLLTAESDGQVAVPGLSLVIDETGLTVCRPDGVVAAVVTWPAMSSLVATGRMRTPAGHPGLVIEATTDDRLHRFVVPTDDPDALDSEIVRAVRDAGMGRRIIRADRRSRMLARRGPLVTVLTILVVVGIALTVLVATGTVKF